MASVSAIKGKERAAILGTVKKGASGVAYDLGLDATAATAEGAPDGDPG